MRWVSITSWPAAEMSVAPAFCCNLSDAIDSAISSKSDDCRLIRRRAALASVRIFCCPITAAAFFSARSIKGMTLSNSGSKSDPSALILN